MYKVTIERSSDESRCGAWREDECWATAVYDAAGIFSTRSLLLGLIANFLIAEPLGAHNDSPTVDDATEGIQIIRKPEMSRGEVILPAHTSASPSISSDTSYERRIML